MLMFHTAQGNVYTWTVGEPGPQFEPTRIVVVQGDEAGARWLRTSAAYHNLPILDNRSLHTWSGEWATRIARDFIASS